MWHRFCIGEKMKNKVVSQTDIEYLAKIRKNVANFLEAMAKKYDAKGIKLLDIAPQVHEGARAYFRHAEVKTLDIDPNSGADYIADLTNNNSKIIPSDSFHIVVCTEVLEHTLNPFKAVNELYRICRGVVLATTPYNFRIHGPLPDCWRFSIHGLKELFKKFQSVQIMELEDENRFLAPIHYTTEAIKRGASQ